MITFKFNTSDTAIIYTCGAKCLTDFFSFNDDFVNANIIESE